MTRLFKIDSKNKIRVLLIEAHGGFIHRSSGLWGGNLVETEKPCTPKNVGKANETSAEEQAELQTTAEVVKKIKEGYVEIPNEVEDLTELLIRNTVSEKEVKFPKCMLVKSYKAQKFDSEGGMLISSKLDGMRCLAVIEKAKVNLFSRTGKPILIMQHIEEALLEIHSRNGWEGILDGELYVHSQDDNFQDVMKACMSYKAGLTEQVQYHIYDIKDEAGSTAHDRYFEYIDILTDDFGKLSDIVIPVEQTLVYSEEEGNALHEQYLQEFYEGSMWKAADLPYKEGRGYSLMKKKDFTDAEFEVIDVIPMDAWPECGKLICRAKNGETFNATPKGTKAMKIELLNNKELYIGKRVTVTYFGLTDDGLPRIAVAKGFRPEGDI